MGVLEKYQSCAAEKVYNVQIRAVVDDRIASLGVHVAEKLGKGRSSERGSR